jgi:hypothetical protein
MASHCVLQYLPLEGAVQLQFGCAHLLPEVSGVMLKVPPARKCSRFAPRSQSGKAFRRGWKRL